MESSIKLETILTAPNPRSGDFSDKYLSLFLRTEIEMSSIKSSYGKKD